MKIIPPTILKGTRDFLPADMAKRNFVMNTIRTIFERFGYENIETPILCPAETILGKYGEEGDRLTYNFTDRGDRQIALPYDLTVPFARFVATNYNELIFPFKRYQIQRVWRAEKPQKGRLREFYQCDIDTIGTDSLLVEAEVALIITEVFQALSIPNIKIKINSRRLLDTMLASKGIPKENIVNIIRIIDKLDKIGEDGVIEELEKIGLTNAREIIQLLTPEGTNTATLEKLNAYDSVDIQELFKLTDGLNVPSDCLLFDPSLARGLDYYTGITYEVVVENTSFGTVCAGGRYDNLCALFGMTDKKLSGMGVAFGFERIMLVLEELGKLNNLETSTKVLLTQFDPDSTVSSLGLYKELTSAGISTELYFEPLLLGKQIKYAAAKKIPYVLLEGPDERATGTVTLKNLESGEQQTIPRNEIVRRLKNIL